MSRYGAFQNVYNMPEMNVILVVRKCTTEHSL